ncbi:MAG: hypothetical protein WCJ57_00415 [Candidatus Falkowbacteria bacterium]
MFSLGKISHNLALFRNNLSGALNEVFSLPFSRVYGVVVLVLNLLNWSFSFLLYRSLGDDLTVLHYNIDFGIDLIGHRGELFVNPVLGLVLIILNLALLLFFARHKHFKFVSYLLWNTAALANTFLLLAALAVYLINFR